MKGVGAHKVDVVCVASTTASTDHLREPVESLATTRARGDSRERLLDGQGVNVLLVPAGGRGGADTVDVGLVQSKDG